MNLSKNIKNFRLENGKTQQEFCEILNVPRYIVSNWEQGRSCPSIEDIIKIADCFECSLDYLLDREGYANDNSKIVLNKKTPLNYGAELSADEITLLENWYKLGVFERESIMIQIKALAEKCSAMVK